MLHSFDQYFQKLVVTRRALQSTFFLLAFIGLLFNFKDHNLLHQIGRNPILYQEIDPVYWLFMILNLPNLFGSLLAPFLDIILITSCIASFIWNRQAKIPLLFFFTYFIYFILYNMMAGHHYLNIGILFMSFPFIFYNNEKFATAFSFCRLLFCFMLFAAGMWKVFRGNLFYPEQAHQLLISTHINSLFTSDPSWHIQIIQFFVKHKSMGHLLWVLLILTELLFVLGFFTVKQDRWLLILYIVFAFGGWFFFGIYNYENFLFLITLTPLISLMETLNGSLLPYIRYKRL